MEPIEDAEQENKEDALEQPEPSSNISENHSSLSYPFETLLQASSDYEVVTELSIILRIGEDVSDPIGLEEEIRIIRIGFPYINPQVVFRDETLGAEIVNFIDTIRREAGFDLFGVAMGPNVTTKTITSDLEELQIRNGLRSSAYLSHRLYHTHIWTFQYESNKVYEKLSDLQLKAMSPVMFASLTCKPNIVLFLAKYGTRYLDEPHGPAADANATSMRMICMRALLSDIIRELVASEEWDSEALKLKRDFSDLPQGLRSKCLNFRILLRCDPNPYDTTVKLATLTGTGIPSLPEMNVVRHVYTSLFPDWGLGLFNPPQLQHMCRCVIRRRLHENWQLPDGISQLELPKILCDYVNLFDD